MDGVFGVRSSIANRLGSATSNYRGLNNSKNDLFALHEKPAYGVCAVKVTSGHGSKRSADDMHICTPRGTIIHGANYNPDNIRKALHKTGFPILEPSEIPIQDSRAHKLLVIYGGNSWHAIPSSESFSRYSGTCVILGDRSQAVSQIIPHKIKLGDCFRLGSVGVVVSEIRYKMNEDEYKLDPKTIQYLKDEALTLKDDVEEELATFAIDESRDDRPRERTHSAVTYDAGSALSASVSPSRKSVGTGGLNNGEKYFCYMCYENHDNPDNPLVAPCECKGDTRYLHVQCLQKWYSASVVNPTSQVIRTTGNGAPACKICGTAYKTAFRRPDGRKANLLEFDGSRPYLSLLVFTRHDSDHTLFNTKFRLNFGKLPTAGIDNFNIEHLLDSGRELLIGRSASSDMVLDYRTVSTCHARIFYENGNFYMQDKQSSNGTMLYLQQPYQLSYSHMTRLKMGRSTIYLQPKRNIFSMFKSFMPFLIAHEEEEDKYGGCYLRPSEYQKLLAEASMETPPSRRISTRIRDHAAAAAVAADVNNQGRQPHMPHAHGGGLHATRLMINESTDSSRVLLQDSHETREIRDSLTTMAGGGSERQLQQQHIAHSILNTSNRHPSSVLRLVDIRSSLSLTNPALATTGGSGSGSGSDRVSNNPPMTDAVNEVTMTPLSFSESLCRSSAHHHLDTDELKHHHHHQHEHGHGHSSVQEENLPSIPDNTSRKLDFTSRTAGEDTSAKADAADSYSSNEEVAAGDSGDISSMPDINMAQLGEMI